MESQIHLDWKKTLKTLLLVQLQKYLFFKKIMEIIHVFFLVLKAYECVGDKKMNSEQS